MQERVHFQSRIVMACSFGSKRFQFHTIFLRRLLPIERLRLGDGGLRKADNPGLRSVSYRVASVDCIAELAVITGVWSHPS